jgi:hypothetical protein
MVRDDSLLSTSRSNESGKQSRVLQGLHEKGRRPGGFATFANSSATIRGNNDGRNFDVLAPQMLQQLQAAHARHLQVGDQALRRAIGQRREKFLCRPVCSCTERARAGAGRVPSAPTDRRRRWRSKGGLPPYRGLSWGRGQASSWPLGLHISRHRLEPILKSRLFPPGARGLQPCARRAFPSSGRDAP